MAKDPYYSGIIEIAIENFNQLGLSRIVYKPLELISHNKNCSLDIEFLKRQYGNSIVFSYSLSEVNTTGVCSYQNKGFLYEFFLEDRESDIIELPPFSTITCNSEHPLFKQFGAGIILHEINHALGIKHAHMLEETNNILVTDISKPDLNNISKGEMSKVLSLYSYGSVFQTMEYTPASLFSIQHYPVKMLEPFRRLNETRITEILLEDYAFSEEMKETYFYLLKKYSGYPNLYTYQDLAALATAIYTIAPDSLSERVFELPNYYLISGIERLNRDEVQLAELLNSLKNAEGFHYSILSQENATLEITQSNYFVENIAEALKIVSLNGPIYCAMKQNETELSVGSDIRLRSDCLLIGKIAELESFQLNVSIFNQFITITRPIRLLVKENVFTRFLFDIDRSNTSDSDYRGDRLRRFSLTLNKTMQTDVSHSQSSMDSVSLLRSLNYSLTLPLCQGFFEGIVDASTAHAYLKALLKLLPRVSLVYFASLNPVFFGLLSTISLVEGLIKACVKNRVNKSAEKCINIIAFLMITEMEYGFYHLWELSDKPELWPGVTERVNQLFLQHLFAPLIKSTAYLGAIGMVERYFSVSFSQEQDKKIVLPLEANSPSIQEIVERKPTFFTAFRVARNTVFSRSFLKTFSFFSRSIPHQENKQKAQQELRSLPGAGGLATSLS
ncbi:MAG: hypothetical protein V4700_04090 [Pseudomonadota bacterium]